MYTNHYRSVQQAISHWYLSCSNFHKLRQRFLHVWFGLGSHEHAVLQYAVLERILLGLEVLQTTSSSTGLLLAHSSFSSTTFLGETLNPRISFIIILLPLSNSFGDKDLISLRNISGSDCVFFGGKIQIRISESKNGFYVFFLLIPKMDHESIKSTLRVDSSDQIQIRIFEIHHLSVFLGKDPKKVFLTSGFPCKNGTQRFVTEPFVRAVQIGKSGRE